MTYIEKNIAIDLIKISVKELIPESTIILFGSRARNDYSHLSDYDILVVTKKTYNIKKKRELKSKLRQMLAEHKIPTDIIIHSESEILSKKELKGHIVHYALNEGIIL
jgi:hypothetical protein